ncbi:MAG TPA: hypothetical protein VGM63_00635 [Mucilaginibacter sp.]|jgi:hypothetical protein
MTFKYVCVKIPALILLLTVSVVYGACAQNAGPDTLFYSKTAAQVIDYFNQSIAYQSELYNGTQYELHPPANKGTFYFENKNYCVPSLIRYNGRWYKNILILYDARNDAMISTEGDNLYILNAERTSDVFLLDHHFIYLKAENRANLDTGYYDMMYDGRSQFLVKRTKLINETNPTEIIYEDKTYFFVKKGDQYLPVNNEGSLMDIFKDKSQDLKQYLKNNKIKFKKNKEYAIARLAAYYDQITK